MVDAELQPLHNALGSTLAPDPALIKQAEAFLSNAQSQAGFGILVLKIIAQDTVQLEIRQQAAVQFKNYVKFRWAPRADAEGDVAQAIADAEKEQIKTHITDLMLSAPPRVRAQLSEALTIISGHDFPARWQGLLPQLLEKLKTEDSSSLNGVLSTADSIYHRYRGQFMTDQLNQELEYSQQFVGPLLAVTHRLTAACTAAAAAASSESLPQHLTNARLALSIFYSLNSPGLTEEFENTLNDWMDCLHALLSLSAPSVASRDPDTESPLDALKATACECLSLFMERNEEEFAPHLEKFATDVWQLLVSVGQDVGQDALAMAAIAFLTTVARSVHHTLFSDPAVLKQVCEGIVIPNLRLRDQDEELFEMNWVEYVRRDTEGSDSDTRRRAASELVRALVEKFPQQTTELFSNYVAALLAEASTAPETAWRAKDAAIFLVSALAVRGRTAAAGATVTNQLVNLQDFYVTHVKPELADADVESRPIIKADCLRFATTFRSQLPQEEALQLFPRATSLLASTHNVVHSYAAILIERLLALRRGGALAFTPAQLGPYLQPLLERLFGALRLPESGENEYVMRAVMRLVMFVGAAIAPVAAVALSSLAEVLLTVARNPRQPGFNHYLFESIAALVKFGCQGHTASIASYEAVLFPPLQIVLQEDVQEFHPYAFQLFAQLVELRAAAAGASLPETYLQLLPGLLSPIFWERPGNVPALGRLLRAYISAVPGEIVSRSLLTGVLGVFQKLIASKAHDHEGMALLDALTVSMDPGVMSQYMNAIWTLLFQRLQVAQTPKISRCFLQSAALMAAKRGGAAVGDSMETVQSGITAMIVQSMWAPTLAGPGSPSEDKIATVGSARMLCEAPSLQSDAAASASGALLAALAQRAAVKEAANGHGLSSQGQEGEHGEGGAEEGFLGYSAAYAKLHNAAEAERDVLADVSEYRADVAGRLAAYAAQHPGRLQSLAHAAPAEAQSALQQLFQRANIVA